MQFQDSKVGTMEWCDDLDHLREVMGKIDARYAKQKKLESSRTYQTKALSYLKNAISRRLAENVRLETLGAESVTISDILNEILKSSNCDGVSKIRYYRYMEDSWDGAYVLVDSAGYDTKTEDRLRVGELVRFKSSCQRILTDTFWAHYLNVPVVVSVDHMTSSILEPRFYAGCLPLLEVPSDACEETLNGNKSTTWIDFPLVVCGTTLGKFTCDYDGPSEELSEQCDDLVDLWAKAIVAAPYLELLARERLQFPLFDIVRDIQACEDTEALFRYCVTKLPEHFNGRNASIFTLATDSLGISKLILRKTSFESAKTKENLTAYNINDTALTAWVARNNRSIRVHNLKDPQGREHQLEQYRVFDSRLTWKNHIQDSRSHTSFLAVPIMVDANRVGGVIRITEKHGRNKYFTVQDQTLLEQIAAEAIGRRLASLQASESLRALSYSDVQKTHTILVSEKIPKIMDVTVSLTNILTTKFPENESKRKLFLLNVLTNDCRHFQHFYAGGSLPNSLTHLSTYKLNGSLTDYVVRNFIRDVSCGKDSIRTTYLIDFHNATQQGAMMPICEDAEVAIACPVAFRQKIYGVLIVKSDRFDITPQQQGYTLQLIAAHAGMMFAKRDHSCLTRLKSRMEAISPRHANEWLSEAERCLSSLEPTCQDTSLEPLDLEKLFSEAAGDAGCKLDVEGAYSNVPVLAHRQALFSVVYNVLKDFCVRRPEGPLQIQSSVQEKWLEVTIKEFFRSADPLCGEMWNLDMDSILHEDGEQNLTLARKIAYYNEIENRRASIDRSDFDLVLRFPAG